MTNLELIIISSLGLWFTTSVCLLVYLKVFSGKSLKTAPVRRSNLSLLTLAAITLLYVGIYFITVVALSAFHLLPPPAASQPAITPATTTSQPATTTSQPAATSASSEPASAPAVAKSSSETFEQIADIFIKIIPVTVILFLVTRLVVGGLDGWGLSLRKIPAGIAYAFLGLFIIYPILLLVNDIVVYVLDKFASRKEDLHPTLQALGRADNTLFENFILVLSAGIAAPILEEIFFRGLVQTVFMERAWGSLPMEITQVQLTLYRPSVSHRWAAIIATSLFFAGIHFMPDSFPVLFVLALALGYLYERTANLWACIFLHGIFNSVNIAIFLCTHK